MVNSPLKLLAENASNSAPCGEDEVPSYGSSLREKHDVELSTVPPNNASPEDANIDNPPELLEDSEWLEGGRGWWVILGCFIISAITLGPYLSILVRRCHYLYCSLRLGVSYSFL
jgi:hypothetical protein